MPRHVPAHAGFFRVTIRVPADRDWCEETQASFNSWMAELAASDHAFALGNMPSVAVVGTSPSVAELILEWIRQPGEDLWEPVDGVIQVGKDVFPQLFTAVDELSVTVVREQAIGRDVVLDDATLEQLEERAKREARTPDELPPDWS